MIVAAATGCGGGGSGDALLVPVPLTIQASGAALVAFQDGSGAWTALDGTAGVYQATERFQNYAVAFGCVAADGSGFVDIYYQTVWDPTGLDAACGDPPAPATVPVMVTLAGVPDGQRIDVWLGPAEFDGGNAAAVTSAPAVTSAAAFTINAPQGMVDVFADTSSVGVGFPRATALYRGSTIDLEAAQALTIDLAAVGLPPESHSLTVQGTLPADDTIINTLYVTPHSQAEWPIQDEEVKPGMTDLGYTTVDARQRQPGDLTIVHPQLAHVEADGLSYDRGAILVIDDASDAVVAVPDVLHAPAPVLDHTANPRATVHIPTDPGQLMHVEYQAYLSTTGPGGAQSALRATISAHWADDAAAIDLTTPDLSQLPGWIPALALAPGTDFPWMIERRESDVADGTPRAAGQRTMSTNVIGPPKASSNASPGAALRTRRAADRRARR
jgi:hypothetical protein